MSNPTVPIVLRRRALMVVSVLLTSVARADVKLASPFTDHMVLQQSMRVPVWGTADPEELVTVEFAGQSITATADKDGKWMLRLSELKASAEPGELTAAGKNRVTCKDVLIGEVWLASGQSNMVFPVSKARAAYAGLLNEAEEIAAANYPNIRMFTARDTKSYEPQANVAGTWMVCSPENMPGFSAVGYLFARDLHKELKVPIGILVVASGASCAEAWISREGMAGDPQIKFMLDSLDENVKYFRTSPQGPAASAPLRPTPINKPRARRLD